MSQPVVFTNIVTGIRPVHFVFDLFLNANVNS
jgi:hypothetical protein